MPNRGGSRGWSPSPACLRFRPLTCEESSARDYDGRRSPALPYGVGRTVSGARVARSCVNPLRYNEEGLGRRAWHPKPLVGLALPRSRRPVEAADARDDDIAGHEAFQLLRCPQTIGPGRLPGIEVSGSETRWTRWMVFLAAVD